MVGVYGIKNENIITSMLLFETAFEYSCAQLLPAFKVLIGPQMVRYFRGFNYNMEPNAVTEELDDKTGKMKGIVYTAYKRSPNWCRDLKRVFPMVEEGDFKQPRNYQKIQDALAKWSTADKKAALAATYRQELRAIKAKDRVIAKSLDQIEPHDKVALLILDAVELKLGFLNDLCPSENCWLESWNYNVLTDPWTDGMNYVFPPESLMGACMTRACLEFVNGKDIVLVVREDLVDREFDKHVSRKLNIGGALGKVIFKPFKTKAANEYCVYLFL